MDSTPNNPNRKAAPSELQLDAANVPIVFCFGPIYQRAHFVDVALHKLHKSCSESFWSQTVDGRTWLQFTAPKGGTYQAELSHFETWDKGFELVATGYIDGGSTIGVYVNERWIDVFCDTRGEKEYLLYLCLQEDTPDVAEFFRFLIQTAADLFPGVPVKQMSLETSDALKHVLERADRDDAKRTILSTTDENTQHAEESTPRETDQVKTTAAHWGVQQKGLTQAAAAGLMGTTDKTYRKYRDSRWLLSEDKFKCVTGQTLADYWKTSGGS